MRRIVPTRRRRGFALILVTAQVALLFSFWNIANRQTGQLLQLEEGMTRRLARDQGSLDAAAEALALLETGTPPTSPFTGVTTRTVRGSNVVYLVVFTDLGDGDWSVQTSPASPYETADPLPATFAPEM